MDRQAIGAEAEATAADFLQSLGWLILARNVRSKLGEIDIVARDEETTVFVEVRTRGPGAWCSALESVTREKARRVTRAARYYAMTRGLEGPLRIDVVAVEDGRVAHVVNALPGY